MRQSLITRRVSLLGAAGLLAGCAMRMPIGQGDPFVALERDPGERLGVCVLNTATGARFGHRMNERFALCSTFKLLLAGVILREIDRGTLSADQIVRYTQADMVPHAPVTMRHLNDGGMRVRALAEAAQVTSDNVAANLLLRLIGGPEGFTEKLRALGDVQTRLDRFEPDLNVVAPGDARDTTTPLAVAETSARFLTGAALSTESRALLIQWMISTQTGARRLRAGLPQAWRAGDKTGTALADGLTNKINDVAIVWPPQGPPFIIAAYLDMHIATETIRAEDEAVLARVGAIAANELTRLP